MSKAVEHIHSEGKFNEVLSTYKDTVLVFDFFATWCGPCKAIEPKINQLATRLAAEGARIKFFKINVDELAEVSTKVGVTAMPTFVIYINGQKHGGEIIGANYEKINTQIITALQSLSPSDATGTSASETKQAEQQAAATAQPN